MSGITKGVFGSVQKKAEAALQNEQLTRDRVKALEDWALKFSNSTLKERIRWLLLGR